MSTSTVTERQPRKPGWGSSFTTNMVSMTWTRGSGWSLPEVVPYAPMIIDPAMVGLHYGQVVFEGLKAYRQESGHIAVFRPNDHGRRFARSAERLAMPALPVALFTEAVEAYVRANQDEVPHARDQSLYLRPIMFASEANLALKPADEYRFLIMGFAAETFFDPNLPAVSVWASQRYVRAVRGGTGEAKCAGNYAAAMPAQLEAAHNRCQQVLWLDALERRWIEEMGGMNVFFVYGRGADSVLITPPLTGSLLPGLTRDSLLTLAAEEGLTVAERPVSIGDLRWDCQQGAVSEGFACGTAAVVTPIGEIKWHNQTWQVGDGGAGPVALWLKQRLLDIQYGRESDDHGWLHSVV